MFTGIKVDEVASTVLRMLFFIANVCSVMWEMLFLAACTYTSMNVYRTSRIQPHRGYGLLLQ